MNQYQCHTEDDMMNRCTDTGVRSIKWKMGSRHQAQMVIVAVETATMSEFIDYAWSLYLDGQLDRIVIDECQELLVATFRDLLI